LSRYENKAVHRFVVDKVVEASIVYVFRKWYLSNHRTAHNNLAPFGVWWLSCCVKPLAKYR
jgi:uncharacterized membrane protein (DUF373 family)